nr:capsid protein [Cressdnaviricota sp.]
MGNHPHRTRTVRARRFQRSPPYFAITIENHVVVQKLISTEVGGNTIRQLFTSVHYYIMAFKRRTFRRRKFPKRRAFKRKNIFAKKVRRIVRRTYPKPELKYAVENITTTNIATTYTYGDIIAANLTSGAAEEGVIGNNFHIKHLTLRIQITNGAGAAGASQSNIYRIVLFRYNPGMVPSAAAPNDSSLFIASTGKPAASGSAAYNTNLLPKAKRPGVIVMWDKTIHLPEQIATYNAEYSRVKLVQKEFHFKGTGLPVVIKDTASMGVFSRNEIFMAICSRVVTGGSTPNFTANVRFCYIDDG